MDTTSDNPRKTSEAGFIINNEELRIVMVGKTGIGKSATGNTILGQKAFESTVSAQSVTVDCQKEKGLVGGQKVAVIDTPGLFDTRYDEDKTTTDLSRCISYAAPGPHVFLVIVRVGKFTEEEKKSVEKIQEIFGQAADKYSLVLFTGGDELVGTIEEFMKGCSDLQELVSRCNNQYHVFNNRKDDQSQVDELLQKIRDIMKKNGGSHYTNEMFQEAERAIEEEKQRILKEKEEKIRRKQEEIEKKLLEIYEKEMKKIQEEMQAQREKEKKEREEAKQKEKQERDEAREREEEREREREREKEEINRERTRIQNKLKEKYDKKIMEEKQQLQSQYEIKARKEAEANLWYHIGQFVKDGLSKIVNYWAGTGKSK